MGAIRYGTSSWSEKGWVGPFYPPGTQPGDFLTHYAEVFDTVEADVTYYRVPSAAMVQGWVRKTPPGFRLSAKFPRGIVHCGQGPRPDAGRLLLPEHVGAERDAFLEVMSRLGDRAGPLVLQFPYFNQQAFRGPEPFLERLERFLEDLPDDFRYAVEVRNKQWLREPLLDLLRRRRAALVWVDLPYVPGPWALGGLDPVTTDFLYVRLVGDRKATDALTKTFDRLVLDRGEALQRWADFVAPAAARATETFAYANNHFAGHGPDTIRDLRARIEARAEG